MLLFFVIGLESCYLWNFFYFEMKRDGLIELFMIFWDFKKIISIRNIKYIGVVVVYLLLLKICC